MTTFDYDGKVFMSAGAAETRGLDGSVPAGYYHQSDDLVWAEIVGGAVRHGALAGVADADGVLRFAYSQVMADGSIVSGECVSHPQRLPDGRIRLREEWRRHGPRPEQGVSIVDELAEPATVKQGSDEHV